MRRGRFGLGALLLLAACPAAVAGVSCSVSTAGVSFGIYDAALATPTDSAGDVQVSCSYLPPGQAIRVVYVMQLSTGLSGDYNPRAMAGPSTLQYNLYQDAARSIIWGNGFAGTGVAGGDFTVGPGVGNGTRTQDFSIYGRIPAQQSVNIGSYSDTITVTLEF